MAGGKSVVVSGAVIRRREPPNPPVSPPAVGWSAAPIAASAACRSTDTAHAPSTATAIAGRLAEDRPPHDRRPAGGEQHPGTLELRAVVGVGSPRQAGE